MPQPKLSKVIFFPTNNPFMLADITWDYMSGRLLL